MHAGTFLCPPTLPRNFAPRGKLRKVLEKCGAPEEIRTPGLRLRRPTLYPLSYRRRHPNYNTCYNCPKLSERGFTTTLTHSLPPYRVIFLWDDNPIDHADNSTLDWMIETMRLSDKELISSLIRDEEHPDYIIATNKSLLDYKSRKTLMHYLNYHQDSVFIFFSYEAIEPDLNVFDYAFTWNPDLKCGDRIARNFTYMYDFRNNAPYTNSLTREQARQILDNNPPFCIFMYSHESEPRDTVFHQISKYKRVDSAGSHLNNTRIKPTRTAKNWYELSVEIKSGYKFSIAMENTSAKGYTTEKIVSSLRAHTVPVYWGDPAVSEYINPKAFINISDYASLDEAIEYIREVDSNNDLWLDMVTQPWQTEEQTARTLGDVKQYNEFLRHIFEQDKASARRVMNGEWQSLIVSNFYGNIHRHSLPVRAVSRLAGLILPQSVKRCLKDKFRL